eukprot:Nk52_evm4s2604 gene=Nk52_evmTU4s2604
MAPSTKAISPQLCIWKDLSIENVHYLMEAQDDEDIIKYIAETLDILDYETNAQSGILLDLYYFTLNFAREKDFSAEKISAFFSIMKLTHFKAIETPYFDLTKIFDFFKELLLAHCVQRPPYSEKIFTLQDCKEITEYALNTYFRHFKLYKYSFTKKTKLDFNAELEGEAESEEDVEDEATKDENGDNAEAPVEGEVEQGAVEKNEESADGGAEEGPKEGTQVEDSDQQPKGKSDGDEQDSVQQVSDGAEQSQGEDKAEGDEVLEEEVDILDREISLEDKMNSETGKNLKAAIDEALESHVAELKLSIEQMMKKHEEQLNEKLGAMEAKIDGKAKKKK